MSLKEKKNGIISIIPINASEIKIANINNKFVKGRNVEGALEELKDNKTTILNTIGNIDVTNKGDIATQLNHIMQEQTAQNNNIGLKANQIDLNNTNNNVTNLSNNKVDKNGSGQITYSMLAQDAREQITGGNTAVVGKNAVIEENIVDGGVTPRKTSFIKSLNLFDGNYIHGKYLVGAGETIKSDPDFYIIALTIEPSTDYSIFIGNDIGKEDGYYWFKIGSSTSDVNTVLTQSNTQEVTLDGAVHFQRTDAYQAGQRITTGASDKSLFVLVSKYTVKNYSEVAKGSRTGSLYNSFVESYKNFNFWAYNKDEVYNKTEVYNKDEINNNNLNAFVKTGEICNITFANKSYYKFEHVIDSNANLNTWRLTKGTINSNVLWEGTDIEGPLQEKGASDFIGGFHGDEIFESVNILADGIVLNLSQDYNIKFNTLTVFVKSTLYRCNTTTPVFTRYKKLEFKNNELIISNRLISLTDNFIISRYTGCGLYSVYKNLLSGYTVNTKPELITSGGLDLSTNLDEGTFFGNGFLVNIKTLSGKTSNFKGSVADFSAEANPRYKLYLDCINSSTGVTVNTNDELNASFSIKITANNS